MPPPIADALTRTRTCWPFVMFPPTVVNAPLPMAYSPPTIVIVEGALMPVMVTLFEIVDDDATAFAVGAKLNGSGVVSGRNKMLPVGVSTFVSMVGGKLLPGFWST